MSHGYRSLRRSSADLPLEPLIDQPWIADALLLIGICH